MNEKNKEVFRQQLLENLTDNILPYWTGRMRDPRGGYYGRRDGYDHLYPDDPKGAILHARILWSFSGAYRLLGKEEYLDAARHALSFIREHFLDKEYGGAYWSVKADGTPLDTKKQYYAIAFIIYGMAEYWLATGDDEVIDEAYSLFLDIEKHARDRERGGYYEAATRDWSPIADMRLSEHDANASKTMNTHLHILEGYTNLLRALKRRGDKERVDVVEEATAELLRVFLERIENPATHHLTLFFDDDWNKYDDTESYGHDIEASWLMLETAEVVGEKELYEATLRHTRDIALAGLKGRRDDGSMVYELHADGRPDADRHWWVQAENVIGQLYQSRYHSLPGSDEGERWLDDAFESWRYIADNLVDPGGEWYWSRRADGSINRDDDKAGFWKCPYHNSRMCIEALRCLE